MTKRKKEQKKKKPVRTFVGRYKGPTKLILRRLHKKQQEYLLNMQILDVMQEDITRVGKPYRGAVDDVYDGYERKHNFF